MKEIEQRYHSGLTDELRAELEAAPARRFLALEYSGDPTAIFEITFTTGTYAPNHIVTLRNEIDGWARDIYGVYKDGAWRFVLPRDEYNKNFEFKFFLDGTTWMKGQNLVKTSFNGLNFTEQQVQFDPVAARHPLPYDSLRVDEDATQQALVANCYHEDFLFDVIVIGSGMGGGILADALTDRNPPVDTLVLDIGCLDFATHIYNLPGDTREIDGRHQVKDYSLTGPDRGFAGGVHMNLGGRSVFWSGVIPKMLDWELYHWPNDVANYLRNEGYAAAEKLMRKHVTLGKYQNELIAALQSEFAGEFQVVNTPRAYHQPEFVEAGLPPKSFILQSTGTFSTAELLLDSLSFDGNGGRDNLHVNLNHMVTDVRRQGNRIVEVVCQDLVGNQRRTYRAKQYVLAAGSMESVRIALQSGLDSDHRLIGKGFTDHPAYFLGDKKAILLKEDSPWAGPRTHARIFLYPANNGGFEGAFFNVEIVINSDYWRERHADNDIQEERLNRPITTVHLKFSLDAALNENNFIQLDRQDGGDGRKKKLITRVDRVAENPALKQTIERLAKRIVEFLDGPDDFSLDEFGGFGADGTPQHAGGSMRMGTSNDLAKCVVNSDLRFLGIENLYACDVSVFPRIPAANPSLTLAALALRLADHLAAKVVE